MWVKRWMIFETDGTTIKFNDRNHLNRPPEHIFNILILMAIVFFKKHSIMFIDKTDLKSKKIFESTYLRPRYFGV